MASRNIIKLNITMRTLELTLVSLYRRRCTRILKYRTHEGLETHFASTALFHLSLQDAARSMQVVGNTEGNNSVKTPISVEIILWMEY